MSFSYDMLDKSNDPVDNYDAMSDSINMQGVGTRVLIVDDDALVASSLAEFLTGEGYRTQVAADRDAAMALLDAGERRAGGADRFGVVLVDLNMAGGGMELIRELRRAYPALVPVAIDFPINKAEFNRQPLHQSDRT